MYHPLYCPPTPSLFHLTIRIKKKISACNHHVKVFLSCDWCCIAGIPPSTAILSLCLWQGAFTGMGIRTGWIHHILAAHLQEGNKNCCHSLIVSGAFQKHSSKASWVRMCCLEQLSLDDLVCVVLHENTPAAASGLSITKMQAPVLDLVEFFWESLPWEGSSVQLASVSDLHQLSPQHLTFFWDT